MQTFIKNGRTYTILIDINKEPLSHGRGFFVALDFTPVAANDTEALIECQRLSYQMFPSPPHVPGQTEASVQRSRLSNKWIAQCHLALRDGDTVNVYRNVHDLLAAWKFENGELLLVE